MSSFTEIPTIDLALADHEKTLPSLLQDLYHALTEVGFLYVVNHKVPETTIDRLVQILPVLFELPNETKAAVALENSPSFLGYSATGSETTAGRPDAREPFEFATELESTWRPGQPLYERLRGPNQWPDEQHFRHQGFQFRSTVEEYVDQMTLLSERFLELVALALHLDRRTFFPYLSDQHRLKLVHYPPRGDNNNDDDDDDKSGSQGQGVGPHKDSSGWFTFLLQASPPSVRGLQVLDKQGVWVDVPVKPGSLVVNMGQAFEVITHGVCKATTHRVLSTSAERYSVPFFQGVRRSLTKTEAVSGDTGSGRSLAEHWAAEFLVEAEESAEGRAVDSPFLRGSYDTWGEAQLRTKVRSHRENGRKFYAEVYEQYIHDDLK